jgi:hypothetical protein
MENRLTSIRVARPSIPSARIGTATIVTTAFCEGDRAARMRCKSSGDRVSFPDIHFRAACISEVPSRPSRDLPARTTSTYAGILVVRRRLPSLGIGLAVDELQVSWTLPVAIAGAIFGTCSTLALGVHDDEV